MREHIQCKKGENTKKKERKGEKNTKNDMKKGGKDLSDGRNWDTRRKQESCTTERSLSKF
jgi:hypothetical protein